MDQQVKIIAQVIQERKMQDRQWGGADHDDTHPVGDWIEYIYHQIDLLDLRDPRERFIKIAALAVAAVESEDRRNGS